MQNPILSAMANQNQAPSNPANMMAQFAEFKKSLVGKDPKAMVEELLSSGKMSQAQFETLKKQAQSLQGFLK